VRARVGDKRVLALVKAFLKAGILHEDGALEDTSAGTPQGSILSPLLSNVALSVLDEHVARMPGGPASSREVRKRRIRAGLPNVRLIRYADDWCLMVKGTRKDAEALRKEASTSWGGASSGAASGARSSITSTPTRPARPSGLSWPR
jgi:RNA-directed DNA polymerase